MCTKSGYFSSGKYLQCEDNVSRRRKKYREKLSTAPFYLEELWILAIRKI